jgi:hypothetical protein
MRLFHRDLSSRFMYPCWSKICVNWKKLNV